MSLRIASGSSTPSFLEVVAAHRLEKSVRDAFSYVISVLADRASTGGLRLLQYDSELFLLFSLLVQGTSLATNGASLAESLYGLRRAGALSIGKPGHAQTTPYMSIKQMLLSCFFLVGAPYIASWAFGDPQQAATGILPQLAALEEPPPLDDDTSEHVDADEVNDREPATPSSQPEASDTTVFQNTPNQSFQSARGSTQVPSATTSWYTDAGADPSSADEQNALLSADALPSGATESAVPTRNKRRHSGHTLGRRLQHRMHKFGIKMLRWLLHIRQHGHMAAGLLNLSYEVAYLLKISPYYSPAHQLAGIVLVRDDGSRAAERMKAQAETRARLWQHGLKTGSPVVIAAAASLWGIHTVGNNTKTAIMAALVLFKVLEWWFTAGEEKVEEARRNVPPPPPAYPPHPAGMALIADASVCPVCHRKRVAPAQLATSGYVFCYKCVYTAVSAHHRCPVTHIRASLDDIRRLFLSAR